MIPPAWHDLREHLLIEHRLRAPSLEDETLALAALLEVLPAGWALGTAVEHPERGYWITWAQRLGRGEGLGYLEAAAPTRPLVLLELARRFEEGDASDAA